MELLLMVWAFVGFIVVVCYGEHFAKVRKDRQKAWSAARPTFRAAAEEHRARLAEVGAENDFCTELCRVCNATIDVSGLSCTSQLYCANCQSIVMREEQNSSATEANFRICPVCKLYSCPQQFRIAYVLYFGIAFYRSAGYVECCHACVRPLAWKMFFLNALTILPMPIGLVQLVVAYLGGSRFSKNLSRLDDANEKAIRNNSGKTALQAYEEILRRHPVSAGVKYNAGITCLRAGLMQEARSYFISALEDCANFRPAYDGLFATTNTSS